MRLSEIRQILAERGIRLTRSLGQNFLHDGNQLRRIVAAAELKATDKVLEIGPGLGPLTELLVATAGRVLAIEKDRRLVEALGGRFPLTQARESRGGHKPTTDPASSAGNDSNRVRRRLPSAGGAWAESDHASGPKLLLVHADALEFLRRESRDWSDWKLVANLPYIVASPVLVELAQARGAPERLVATVQLEVAHRLMARPREEDFGVLTLLVQLRYEPRGWFKIPASCFFPAPEVDSACVTLVRRAGSLLNGEEAQTFTKIVKRAFSQRRKVMFKLLKEDWSLEKLERAGAMLELPPQARAESVGLEQFVRLTRALTST